MTEDRRRAEVLQAEQAVRLLARSFADANASKLEFDAAKTLLSGAADSVTEASATLGHLRQLIATDHDQAAAAIARTVTQAQASLEEATTSLTLLVGKAETIGVEQASSTALHIRELEANVVKATGQLDAKADEVGRMVTNLLDLGEHLSRTASLVQTNVIDSSNRVLESLRVREESVRQQAAASAFELMQRLTTGQSRIENVVREHATASTTELRKAVDAGVQLLLQRLAQAQQEIQAFADAEHKLSRTLLFKLYFVEGTVLLGIALLLWRHW